MEGGNHVLNLVVIALQDIGLVDTYSVYPQSTVRFLVSDEQKCRLTVFRDTNGVLVRTA